MRSSDEAGASRWLICDISWRIAEARRNLPTYDMSPTIVIARKPVRREASFTTTIGRGTPQDEDGGGAVGAWTSGGPAGTPGAEADNAECAAVTHVGWTARPFELASVTVTGLCALSTSAAADSGGVPPLVGGPGT